MNKKDKIQRLTNAHSAEKHITISQVCSTALEDWKVV